jgi:hypothetical protein
MGLDYAYSNRLSKTESVALLRSAFESESTGRKVLASNATRRSG